MKHRFHRLQSTSSLQGSFNHQPNHLHPTPPPDTNLPPLAEDGEEHPDKGPVYDPKQEVFVSLFVCSDGPSLFVLFFLYFLVLIVVPYGSLVWLPLKLLIF
jgi:hypothetical protein